MGAIYVTGLEASDLRVTAFAVECYSDSALTQLVSNASAHAVYNLSTGAAQMIGYIVFSNLTTGITYYLRSCAVVPQYGPSQWSSTYSLVAEDDGTDTLILNPMSTKGDMIVAGDNGVPIRLPAGAANYMLVSSGPGGAPNWQAQPTQNPTAGWSSGNNANGYWVKDPMGHIRQWGRINIDINQNETAVSFPTNFTNASSVSVAVSTYSSADRITFIVNDGSLTAYGFSVDNNGSGGYALWIADGY